MAYDLTKAPGELVRVAGLAAEPFLISCGSCQSYLNRLFSRKASYTAEEYSRKRQPYVEAAQIAGWEIVDPEPKAVEPEVQQVVAPEPPIEEPPEQVTQILLKAFAEAVEPEVPVGTSPEARTWLERMMGEDPAESLVKGIDFSELT